MSIATKYAVGKLGRTNWSTWHMQFQGAMESKGWEDALDNPASPHSTKVKGALKQCVEDVHLRTIQEAPDAATAWQRLRQLFNQTSAANYMTLRRQFNTLTLKTGDSILDLINKAQELADQLIAAGDQVDERALVAQILEALPSNFKTIKQILKRQANLPSIDVLRSTLLHEEEEQKHEAAAPAKQSATPVNREMAFASNADPRNRHQSSYPQRPSSWSNRRQDLHPRFQGKYLSSNNPSARPWTPQPHRHGNYGPNRQYPGMNSNGGRWQFDRRPPSGGRPHWARDPECDNPRFDQYCSNGRLNPMPLSYRCDYCGKRGHEREECELAQRDHERMWRLRDPPNNGASREVAFTAGVASVKPYRCPDTTWYIDSAATKHMSGNSSIFLELTPLPEPAYVTYGNGEKLQAVAQGTVVLNPHGAVITKVTLHNVLYIPGHHANLLSMDAVVRAGAKIAFSNARCVISTDGAPVINAARESNLWAITDCSYQVSDSATPLLDAVKPVTEMAMAARQQQPRTAEEWHSAYGHLGYQNLAKLPKMVKGLDLAPSDFLEAGKKVCSICQQNKQVSLPYEPASTRTCLPLELVHSDLCGPITPASKGGAKYIATFLDDYTKFSVVRLLKQKNGVQVVLPEVFNFMERQCQGNHCVKALRTDNGTEYVNEEVSQYLSNNGIVHQTSNPYTPQQNGKAERLNKTLLEKTRSMINGADLPAEMWGEAVITANMLRNRSPATGIAVTPYEMFLGRQPDVSYLRPYGGNAYALIPKQRRTTKLDEVSVEGKLVGYELEGSGYRLMLSDGTICSSRNVVFSTPLAPTPPTGSPTTTERRVTFRLESDDAQDTVPATALVPQELATAAPTTVALNDESDDDEPPPLMVSDSETDDSDDPDAGPPVGAVNIQVNNPLHVAAQVPVVPAATAPVQVPAVPTATVPVPATTPANGQNQTATAATGGQVPPASGAAPAAASNTAARRSTRTNRGVPSSRMAEFALTATDEDTFTPAKIPEPTTFKEAMASEHKAEWLQAMNEEIGSLLQQGTWEYVDTPPGVKPIPVKWVFKVKRDGHGNLERFKARLVAKGFKQQEGIDYDEVFAPVTKHSTFRTIMAIAAAYDMEIQQLDIKTAFLQGELSERVYIQQPEGFEEGGKSICCLLNKAIYGLKQAPRVWYDRLHKELINLNFQTSEADPGLYVYKGSDITLYLLVYVDDILLVSTDKSLISNIKGELMSIFDARDLGDATTYLGINILRDRGSRTLSLIQERMTDDIITKFDLGSAKTVTVPMSCSTKLSKEEGAPLDKLNFPYSQLVGSLMYLTVCTRPDISYSVGALARYMTNPTTVHGQAAKTVVKYLKGTTNHGITYGPPAGKAPSTVPEIKLTGYCDADYAGDLDTRRSTTGYVFMINGGAVTWQSKLQPTVAVSTAEAEYMSAAAAVKEGLWLRKLMADLGYPTNINIFADNQSAIKLLRNPISSLRSKHIDVVHHFARERVMRGEVTFSYISTTDQMADILTKALPGIKHHQCKEDMGVKEVSRVI